MPQEIDQAQPASAAVPIGEFLLLTSPAAVDRAYQDDREIQLEFDDGQARRQLKAVLLFYDASDGYRGRTTEPVGFGLQVIRRGQETQHVVIRTKIGH